MHDQLDWPEETEQLPPMSLERFKSTLFSFAAGTGLGRALLRLPDELLRQWMALLFKCERTRMTHIEPPPGGGHPRIAQ